jgi:hypothetical protein
VWAAECAILPQDHAIVSPEAMPSPGTPASGVPMGRHGESGPLGTPPLAQLLKDLADMFADALCILGGSGLMLARHGIVSAARRDVSQVPLSRYQL